MTLAMAALESVDGINVDVTDEGLGGLEAGCGRIVAARDDDRLGHFWLTLFTFFWLGLVCSCWKREIMNGSEQWRNCQRIDVSILEVWIFVWIFTALYLVSRYEAEKLFLFRNRSVLLLY